jgi:hypothetical protein
MKTAHAGWAVGALVGVAIGSLAACTDTTEPLTENSGTDASVGGSAGSSGQGGAATGGGAGASGAAGEAGSAGDAGPEKVVCEDTPTDPYLIAFVTSGTPAHSTWGFHTVFTTEARRCHYAVLTSNCFFYDCLASHYTGEQKPLQGVNVGALNISSSDGFPDIVVQPNSQGAYPSAGSALRFKPGDVITYSAPGGDLPGFIESVTVPPAPTLLEPAMDASIPAIDPSVSLTVKWAPMTGKTKAILGQYPKSQLDAWDFQEIWCTFDGSQEEGTFPMEAMQLLDSSSTIGNAVGVASIDRACYQLGARTLEVSASAVSYTSISLK